MVKLGRTLPPKAYSMSGTVAVAADDNKFVTTTNMKVGTYTIAAQPTIPSRVSVTVTAVGTADTMGTITVTGYSRGILTTDVITPVADDVAYGTKFFDADGISSIVGAGWVIDAGSDNDTLIIGCTAETELYAAGRAVSVTNISGNTYIADSEQATTSSYPVATAEEVTFTPDNAINVASDGSGSSIKYIIWEV